MLHSSPLFVKRAGNAPSWPLACW